ncbi:ubiquitin-like domain-containing protein [Chitinophaga niabensis]|uniref:ubiquitin-like domain-containing protein n=1 Tax=Chitinophaga niabensis TaxID=536979 RepID=UPI0031BBCA71
MKKLLTMLAILMAISGTITTTAQISASVTTTEEPQPHPNNLYVKGKRADGTTFTLWLLVFPTSVVGDVKAQAGVMAGVDVSTKSLYYNGQALDDSLTLSAYGIGSNVWVTLR